MCTVPRPGPESANSSEPVALSDAASIWNGDWPPGPCVPIGNGMSIVVGPVEPIVANGAAVPPITSPSSRGAVLRRRVARRRRAAVHRLHRPRAGRERRVDRAAAARERADHVVADREAVADDDRRERRIDRDRPEARAAERELVEAAERGDVDLVAARRSERADRERHVDRLRALVDLDRDGAAGDDAEIDDERRRAGDVGGVDLARRGERAGDRVAHGAARRRLAEDRRGLARVDRGRADARAAQREDRRAGGDRSPVDRRAGRRVRRDGHRDVDVRAAVDRVDVDARAVGRLDELHGRAEHLERERGHACDVAARVLPRRDRDRRRTGRPVAAP